MTFTIAATAGFDSGVADPGIRGHRSLGVWVSLQDFGKPATSGIAGPNSSSANGATNVAPYDSQVVRLKSRPATD